MRQPCEDRVLDGVGDGRLADRQPVRARLRAERPEQLLDVEWHPIRPLVDGIDDLTGRRQAGVEDERRHEGGLGLRQRRESYLLGDPLGEQS